MSALPLLTRSLSESWRGVAGWGIGILGTILLYVPLYPSMKGEDMQALIASLPKELVDTLGYSMTTGAGYVSSTYFGLMGFLLLSIAGIMWGTAAIAGDEESGGLELTLAHGVGRVQVVLERSLSVFLRLAFLGTVGTFVMFAFNGSAELELSGANLVAITAALIGVAMLAASVALAAGALTGRRAWALGAGTAVVAIGYAFNAVANQSEPFEWLHDVSPYAWAFKAAPLSNGVDWVGLGLLYGSCAVLIVVASVALNRRDIGT